MDSKQFEQQVENVAELIVSAKRVVVFTGAGISTESGIPDFRGPNGLWTKHDPNVFTLQRFLHDPQARKLHWKLMGGTDFIHSGIEPNQAHYAVTELQKMGKLDCVITQNVDGLHEKSGTSRNLVIHLHGNMEMVKCLNCDKHYPMDEVRQWLAQGIEVPDCPNCGGLLKPDAVFFGEAMPLWETAEAQRRSEGCDLCIVIGSSLVVFPAALMPRYAVESGAKLVMINRDPTDLDLAATICIREGAGTTMSNIIRRVKEKLN